MAKRNKHTVAQVDEALDRLHSRLTRTLTAINKLRVLRKKLVTGQIKQPRGKEAKLDVIILDRGDVPFDDKITDLYVGGSGSGEEYGI